jgi:hypothetical protein
MMRPNKPEGLPLETLFCQVLEFEGKARANPIEGPFRCYPLRLDWKVIARYKHSSLFWPLLLQRRIFFYNIDTWQTKPGGSMVFPPEKWIRQTANSTKSHFTIFSLKIEMFIKFQKHFPLFSMTCFIYLVIDCVP